jgi:hypothetical protein
MAKRGRTKPVAPHLILIFIAHASPAKSGESMALATSVK